MKKVLLGIGLAVSVLAPGVAAARGDKPVIGVIEFKNESGAGWWSGGVGWELAGMLSNELGATNAFRVVERSKLESVLAEQNLMCARNQELCGLDQRLQDGDEIAFFPPVTGG